MGVEFVQVGKEFFHNPALERGHYAVQLAGAFAYKALFKDVSFYCTSLCRKRLDRWWCK